MIDEVMFEIREMTGQMYRDHYASERDDTSTDVPVIAQRATDTDTDAAAPQRVLARLDRVG
jgi:hypothetical protein